jgi:hypothetical protein
MSTSLLFDALAGQTAAWANAINTWKGDRHEPMLRQLAESLLDFAAMISRTPEKAWEALHAGNLRVDLAEAGTIVLALMSNVERRVRESWPLLEAAEISEFRWRGAIDTLRESMIRFAQTWPAPQPWSKEAIASAYRANFAFDDGETGRPLAGLREKRSCPPR